MQKVVIAVVVIVGDNGRNDVNEDGEGGGVYGQGVGGWGREFGRMWEGLGELRAPPRG